MVRLLRGLDNDKQQRVGAILPRQRNEANRAPLKGERARGQAADGAVGNLTSECLGRRTKGGAGGLERIIARSRVIVAAPAKELVAVERDPIGKCPVCKDDLPASVEREDRRFRLFERS